eukprot:2931933-Pyramimonas_sp.AAC.1
MERATQAAAAQEVLISDGTSHKQGHEESDPEMTQSNPTSNSPASRTSPPPKAEIGIHFKNLAI